MRKMQCQMCPTRAQGAICDLPNEALEEFKAASSSAVYRPRQVIFTEGSPSPGLYLVCHGTVKLYHSDRFGRDHILEVAGPGAILGELSTNGNNKLSVSAETVSEAQLCFMPRDLAVDFIQRHPMTGVRLIAALSNELASARRKVRDLALKGAESRLAALLLDLARAAGELSPGKRLHLRQTRRELAEMIGVSTETAIRLLSKLKKKHAIGIERRDILIYDVEKLTQVANYDDTDV